MNREQSRARRRENPEPEEGNHPVPKPVLVLIAGLFLWGCYYLIAQTGYPLVGGDSRTPVAATGDAGGAVSGASVFSGNCVACHQAQGQGVPGTFPPLAGSDWVTSGDGSEAVAIVLRGLQGAIEVKGTTYNGNMPAFAGQLSDEEVAAVVTHIRGSWGNDAASVDAAQVSAIREAVAGDNGPWSGGQAVRAAYEGQ